MVAEVDRQAVDTVRHRQKIAMTPAAAMGIRRPEPCVRQPAGALRSDAEIGFRDCKLAFGKVYPVSVGRRARWRLGDRIRLRGSNTGASARREQNCMDQNAS